MIALRSSSPITYPALSGGALAATLAVREAGPEGAPKPRLLDQVREAIRARHYSRRTEKTYVACGKRHPAEMGAPEVTRFLTSLAVDGNVAASTQNQALSAFLFLYRDVLEQDLPWLDNVVRATGAGAPRLMALLMYGAGLGLLECAMLPGAVKADLGRHLHGVKRQHERDLQSGAGWVELPWALARDLAACGARPTGCSTCERQGGEGWERAGQPRISPVWITRRRTRRHDRQTVPV